MALALLVVWNKLLEQAVLPLLVLFNTLPKVALAPLFVIWLGYGIWPNIVIAVTVSFFPVVINTAAGLTNVDPDLLDLVRSLKASKWQIFRKIRFPNALPYIFAGLKLNATLSVIGAIVGEFVASDAGLGALIIAGGVTLDTPSIFASLCLIALLGLVLYAAVVAVERLVMPWEFRETRPV
jgi:NitT/TauT family transport system permease protein